MTLQSREASGSKSQRAGNARCADGGNHMHLAGGRAGAVGGKRKGKETLTERLECFRCTLVNAITCHKKPPS